MKYLITISVLANAIILSGCGKNLTSSLLTFEPPSLKACDPAAEVTVKWDVRSAHPGVQNVQLFVTDGKTENLFAEGNALGDAKTGPWARPGKPLFVLKEKASGNVLAENAIVGPKCD